MDPVIRKQIAGSLVTGFSEDSPVGSGKVGIVMRCSSVPSQIIVHVLFIWGDATSVTDFVWAQDFGYEGIHGPSQWVKDFNSCVGKRQSPINIEEHDLRNVTLKPLQFSGLDKPRFTSLVNNGHTVMLQMNGSEDALVTGGPLEDGVYAFEQLHFHWGANDWEGSEDTINNHSFAMELHAVFYKIDYKSVAEAVNHPDGLTVLAYFFEAGDEPSPIYEFLVESLPNVESLDKEDRLPDPLILESILVPGTEYIQNYFTYNGSLTTPPCTEVVTWIDFKQPLLLSHKQIAAFRKVRSVAGERLTHNFRPVQPLEDRFVFHNVPGAGHPNIEYHMYPKVSPNNIQQNHHHHRPPPEAQSGQLANSASILAIFVSFSVVLL